MGFIRNQEEKMAARLLLWQYERMNIPSPGSDVLGQRAAKLVDDAHRIARERGSNVVSIMRDLVADVKGR